MLSSIQKTIAKQTSPTKWVDGFIFVITMWLLSRLVIVVGLQLLAPLCHLPPVPGKIDIPPSLPTDFAPGFIPKSSWDLFTHWDGNWYEGIARHGYDYAHDGHKHTVAFFPLFPLLARAVMTFGLPFNIAGPLVNSLAFLGALLCLYFWSQELYGSKTAKWATAVMAWFPFSLYGTVTYTEGLFMLLTTAALWAFNNRQYTWAAVWGALATATRVPAVALIPAFILVAWKERRPVMAYVAALASGLGLVAFIIYCAIAFADPLAFVHVQAAWQQENWLAVFAYLFNLSHGFSPHTTLPGIASNLTRVFLLLGSIYLLWYYRNRLPRVAAVYGFCCLGLILCSGIVFSFSRYVYGIVPFSMVLGMWLASYPRWGYFLMGLFAIALAGLSIRFAWWYWVA